MAMESFKYWFNWGDYLEYEDEKGLAKYINTGALMIKSQGHARRTVVRIYR